MFTYFSGRDFSVVVSQLMLLSFVALLPFIGGCSEDDNPIVDEHDLEEDAPYHADADGFVLEVEGAEVYRQFQGQASGGLTVGVGEEIEVHVAFLNPSGAEIHVGEEEEDEHEHGHGEEEAFFLGLTGYDSAIIDIHLSEDGDEHAEDEHEGEEHEHEHEHEGEEHEHEGEEHEDEHGEEGFGVFEVVGLKAGTTQIALQLLHGDHPDFTAALPIPVTVQ